MYGRRWLVTLLAIFAGGSFAADPAAPAFSIKRQFDLGGDGGWDYLTVDAATHRLYVSRADRVMVVDTISGAQVATIADTPGVHGIALAPDLGKGFTSNGRSDTVTVFDLATLRTTGTIAVGGHNPDAIFYDQASGRVLTFNGGSHDVSLIDPVKAVVVATLTAGGKPEFAAGDGKGRVFANVEDTSQLMVIDALAARLQALWTLPGCESPTGLALDEVHRRLFSVCRNAVLVVTGAADGRHVATIPIGRGPDATTYDADLGLIYSSNGLDGTLTIIREDDPDHYSVINNLPTQKSARTLALDRSSHKVYLVAARFGPAPAPAAGQPRPRPAMLPDSFTVLEVGPD